MEKKVTPEDVDETIERMQNLYNNIFCMQIITVWSVIPNPKRERPEKIWSC
jgi:hypothetical protein